MIGCFVFRRQFSPQSKIQPCMQPRAKHRAKPAFLRPNKANKANKAKLSSVSECLHSGVSLVWGGKTRLTRLNYGVGILEQLVGGWVTRLNYCGRHAGKI